MWLIEFIIMSGIGAILVILGLVIWKMERISLIHDYHYTKVAEKDKKPYTEKMGKACIIMGLGMILTGLIGVITKSHLGWVFFIIFFLWGIILMLQAQKKYNGGLF